MARAFQRLSLGKWPHWEWLAASIIGAALLGFVAPLAGPASLRDLAAYFIPLWVGVYVCVCFVAGMPVGLSAGFSFEPKAEHLAGRLTVATVGAGLYLWGLANVAWAALHPNL